MESNGISINVRYGGRELTVRTAERDDLPILCEAELVCFPDEPWTPEMFYETAANPSCGIYIMQDMQMSKMVAYCVLYFAADEADLANIAVVSDERRRGYGKIMIDNMLEISRDNGVSRMFLEVRESNEAARSLYKICGFDEIGKRRKYYKNPREDAIVMMKILAKT